MTRRHARNKTTDVDPDRTMNRILAEEARRLDEFRNEVQATEVAQRAIIDQTLARDARRFDDFWDEVRAVKATEHAEMSRFLAEAAARNTPVGTQPMQAGARRGRRGRT